MYREFDAVYPGVMEVADLFTHTTIREQAAHIRKALGRDKPKHPATPTGRAQPAASQEHDMDTLLAMLADGKLSADEAQALLAG
jgi:polyketide synthase PksN